jgi:Tfp pilus assembly PilM family ATPase
MAFGAKVAAVEFYGDEVRLVVAKSGRRPGLLEAHAATAVYETPEARHDALADALDEVLGRMRSRPTAFVFCADTSRATVRTLTVPFRGAGRVAKAVPFEIESHLPFPLDELALDHHIVAEIGGETEVLAVGMRRTHMEEPLALLDAAGVDPEAVNLDVCGLTALWHARRHPAKGLEAVLHLRENGSCLAVMHQRSLAFFRYLPMGGTALCANPGRMAREVQNTLRSFMAQWRGGGEIAELNLTGADLSPEEVEAFSQALNLPVVPSVLLDGVRGGKAIRRRDGDGTRFNRWEAALGAAHAAAGKDFSFDLLQSERTWENSAGGLVPHLLFSACLGLILVLGWGFYYYETAARNRQVTEEVRAKIESLKAEIDTMSKAGLGPDVDVTPFGDPPTIDLLKEIGARMPEKKVTVTEVKIAPPGAQSPWLSISGETPNAADFNAVFEDLKKSAMFKVADDANIKLQGAKTFFRVRAVRPHEEVSSNEPKP